jgi:transcriptional regulator with XRE-family HTH domain
VSNFSHELESLLGKHRKSAREIAKATGLSQAALSKWRNAQQTFITEEDLTKISNAITKDRFDQAKLLLAHLKDECIGPAKHLIEINIRDQDTWSLKDDQVHYGPKLSPKLERAFELLKQNVTKNKALADMVLSFADLCERGRGPGTA